MKRAKLVFILFWMVVVIDVLFILQGTTSLRIFSKPLLVPLLALSLITNAGWQNHMLRLVIAGLFFSFLGDVFLLRDDYFIPGLICFLLTHILYAVYFIKTANKNGWYLKKQPLLLLPVFAYSTSLVWLLYPGLKQLTVPVTIYAFIISVMMATCINLYKQINRSAYTYFFTGACFFVLSDSLLAVDKFYQSFSFAGIIIMVTYVLAQYLIVKGSIEMTDNS
jgi:uncharacterized membrane protein YhhN